MSSESGFVEPRLREEFPGLRLAWTEVDARVRGSSREVDRRLRELSNRYRGAGVVAMRTQPIPHAYRTFFRQVGLDPDAARIPSEAAAVRRLLHGRFQSRNALADALLIAVVETGVPVWALDARVAEVSSLGIRVSVAGDRLGVAPDDLPLSEGQLVVADAGGVHAALFGEPAPGHGPGPRTSRIILFAVGVDGVPAIHLEEALWVASDVLRTA
jgi:DNA/RNA-binding domain of Phe-tRNA-synthetase-like protein